MSHSGVSAPLCSGQGLVERRDGFDYGYRMKCACGALSDLDPVIYLERESVDAMMACVRCGTSIHYGPAAAGIRDDSDPALENSSVARFAWYHTSTSSDWPSAGYADQFADQMRNAEYRLGHRFTQYIQCQTTKALHVGTYEAAIENMLRRMDDQADAASTFYLYRVRIDVDSSRINEGYRDENSEPASQISLADLSTECVDIIRYLNTHEAIGSLSLAIHPKVLRSVQVITIPVRDLAETPSEGLSKRLDALQEQEDALCAEAADWSEMPAHDLRLMGLGLRPDPDGLGGRSQAIAQRSYTVGAEILQVLSDYYLAGVSRLVRRNFCDALGKWRGRTNATVPQLVEFFAASAATMTRSREVIERLSVEPTRLIDCGHSG